MTNPMLQWAFTATFLAIAAHCVLRMASGGRGAGLHRSRRGPAMVDQFCHLLMSLDMAAMAWPWWSEFPAAPQLVAFALAAAWFTVPALSAMRSQLGAARRPFGGIAAALVHHGVHAVMMLAMVWMVATMPSGPRMGAGMGAGMGGHHHAATSPAATAAGITLIVALLAAAVGYVTTLLEPAARRAGWPGRQKRQQAAGAAMSAGMAAMCWLMISA